MKQLILLLFSICFFTIVVGQNITIDFLDIESCEGEPFIINPQVSGGDGNYTYVWSPVVGLSCIDCLNPTVETPINSIAYTLSVTDGSGETADETINVFVHMTNTTNLDVTICEGESYVIGEQMYSQTGSYQQILVDQNGCDSIVNLDLIVVSNGIDLYMNPISANCEMENGSVELTVNGGLPPYSYTWSNGSSDEDIFGISSGTYCVTVIDANNCALEDCVTVALTDSLFVTIVGPDQINCSNEVIVLRAEVMGATPEPVEYTYKWTANGQAIGSTQEIVINDISSFETIEVLVIDPETDCSAIGEYIVPTISLIADILPPIWDCTTSSTVLDASPSTQGDHISYQWFDANLNLIGNSITVEILEPGQYTLLVTNTELSDCFATAIVEVQDLNELFTSISIFQTLIACNTYELSLVSITDLSSLTYSWSLPNGTVVYTQSVVATETGLYTLNISQDGGNCMFSQSVFLTTEATSCADIDGFVRWDEEGDCMNDTQDAPMENWLVTATENTSGQRFSALTNSDGYYRMNVPTGEYIVVAHATSTAWLACIEVGTATVLSEGDMASLDFPFTYSNACPVLNVSLSTPQLRRCFDNTYYISVCNEGTGIAEDPEVTLILDDYLSFVTSPVSPDQIIGQEIHWSLDDLQPNECQTFWVRVHLSCDAILGQTHCSRLYATPDSICVQGNEDWTGANLEIISACEDDEVAFKVVNTGAGDLLEAVDYVIIEDGVMMLGEGGTIDDLPSTFEQRFAWPANGSTYTFEVYQAPGHPYTMSLATSIEGCGINETGNFSTGFVTQFAIQTSLPAIDLHCIENIGSWDPNDKSALPVGYGPEHYIVPETEINYLIRFQNTGTDTAFTVVIEDELPEWLDLTTFKFRNASHDYRINFQGERNLTVIFDNIQLPDSTTNLLASQGFLDFSIWPKSDIPLGTVLENDAAIYFDFNDPVITNTVFHTVDRNFIDIISWVSEHGFTLDWKVSPNPTNGNLTISIQGDVYGEKRVVLIDLQGEVVQDYRFYGQEFEFNLSQLPNGYYAVQLIDNQDKTLGVGKLIKQ